MSAGTFHASIAVSITFTNLFLFYSDNELSASHGGIIWCTFSINPSEGGVRELLNVKEVLQLDSCNDGYINCFIVGNRCTDSILISCPDQTVSSDKNIVETASLL